MRFAANAESIRTKGHKDKRYNVYVFRAKQLIHVTTFVLMSFCSYVPALAARYGVSPYVSLATRTLVRGQPRSGLLCVL